MEKQCEICGGFFETNNKNRKYCDDCAKHTETRRREYENAVRDNKRRYYEPRMYRGICSQCGETFETCTHLIFKHSEKEFCSVKCMEQWKHDHANCLFCGKSLKGNPYYDVKKPTTQFCSDECREAYRYKEAKENGDLHVCAWCGKEFIRKGRGTFCCKKCYTEAQRNGWKPPSNTGSAVSNADSAENNTVIRRERCIVCGKMMNVKYTLPLPDRFPTHVCSEVCLRKYERKRSG